MAIIEEVADAGGRSPSPPSSPSAEYLLVPAPAPPPAFQPVSSPDELAQVLGALSAKLALPGDLLPAYLEGNAEDFYSTYRSSADSTLRAIVSGTEDVMWADLTVEQQATVLDPVVRLKGEDKWTSSTLVTLVDEITSRSKLPDVAIVLLTTTLRTLFAPHPSVVNARALPRPAGGVSALDDSRGYQPWKTSSAGWGAANALRWAASTLSDDDVLKHLGVILPPTLTLMDDWEPRWRDTGAWVLSSLTHSMGLHSPPLSHVLPTALILVHGLKGDKKANNYGTIVDTALVNGWSYVSSNDRDALAAIANNTVIITQELGTGIVRWIKSIIPALLEPLQYPPTTASLPHFAANLRALSCVLTTIKGSGRIARWRGQMLDVGSRCWLQVSERDWDNDSQDLAKDILQSLKVVFSEIEAAYPTVRGEEFDQLLNVNKKAFSSLVAAHV
ncbi:uncharacterized protein EHS24_006208 [Apiotrichum porosum]|uniref:Uncharacterized protein n=1 Tax=Apiotrichum porosum TaxID=105984 RepID=A0A427Y0K5_9TREE|nr:uncharacterized protein EHS24_006208 [Apiotrichum porosum]RSH84684.1 hypothetical protein EHS24_006208 [Apiotrichum porosum]